MLVRILVNFIYQFLYLFGILMLVCFLVGLLEKLFYRLCGRNAHKVCIALGFIGTPVHECGHALMCLLFGHKITEMVLFQPSSENGVLGYVTHSYDRRNVYQVVGNFFIAIGPAILGTGILVLMMFLLQRPVFDDIMYMIGSLTADPSFTPEGMLLFYVDIVAGTFRALFAVDRLMDPLWWLYLLISLSIAIHMGLSDADIKNGIVGLLAGMGVLFVLNIILVLIGGAVLDGFNAALQTASGWAFSFLSVSLLLSAAIVLITALLRGAARLISKR